VKLDVVSPGAFASLSVKLQPGESFVSESGLMVRMAASIESDVTARPKGSGGGLLGGLKRMLSGDSFFMSTYKANAAGEVVLAPVMPGDVHVVELDGGTPWMCAGGSYIGSGPDVSIATEFQGLKGMFSGESLFYLKVSGTGPVAVAAFGQIREIDVQGEFVVDTGHVVAYAATLQYEITKAGTSWTSAFLSGEGLVMRFTGRGKLLIQSHNPNEFGRAIGPQLPQRS
jgi:uncharacterized protein (TIGR00266 family)